MRLLGVLSAAAAAAAAAAPLHLRWPVRAPLQQGSLLTRSSSHDTAPCSTAGQVFTSIGQLELFYDQAPDVMRSCSMALVLLSVCIGSYLSGKLGLLGLLCQHLLDHQPLSGSKDGSLSMALVLRPACIAVCSQLGGMAASIPASAATAEAEIPHAVTMKAA